MANGPMFNSRLFLSTKGDGLTSSFTFRAPNTELQSTCRRTSNNLDGLKVSARFESSKVFFHRFGIRGYFPRYVSPRQKHPMTGTNICKHLYKDCSALLISSVVVLIQFFFPIMTLSSGIENRIILLSESFDRRNSQFVEIWDQVSSTIEIIWMWRSRAKTPFCGWKRSAEILYSRNHPHRLGDINITHQRSDFPWLETALDV